MMESDRIYVYIDHNDFVPVLMGILHVNGEKGKQILSFEYDDHWMSSHYGAISFDPDLQMIRGRQYAPDGKTMFGIFADASPDRWGRTLLKRREAILARSEGRKPKSLTDVDYLLGVYDETRMGAARFSLEEGGPFLSNDSALSVPPWMTLRKLEAASMAFEKNNDGQEEKWLKQLIAPGSSLGGARPKASVIAPDDSLWIAKFPSKYDEINVGAWEMVVHDLASLYGLNVPEAKLETFSKNGSTFLCKRFDRDGEKRIHVASAMTLLGKTDGAGGANGSSYLDIASLIKRQGAKPKKDLRELWRRIVFNISVSNTDDHLRNHGFVLTSEGWELSPLYDVNPNIYGENLSLNIDLDSSVMSFELARSVAKLFELTGKEAEAELDHVKNTVSENWRKLADKYGIKRAEIENMEPAFKMEYKE